jgi:hypothetical protein
LAVRVVVKARFVRRLLLVAALLVAALSLCAFAGNAEWYARAAAIARWPDDMITAKVVNAREEGLEMRGEYPSLNALAGAARRPVNERVAQVMEDKAEAAKDIKARLLVFSYEAFYAEPVVSIIIKTTVTSASSKTEVVSVNFNAETGELLSLSDIMRAPVAPLADKLLVEMMRRAPERYNPGFSGMRPDQAFSLTEDSIVFWFDEFQLAPGSEGVLQLSLALDGIMETVVTQDEYWVKSDFNLRMVWLGICRELGYEVQRRASDGKITVLRDGELLIALASDINVYQREGRLPRSLESAPESVSGRVYVPVTFFDQILSLVAYRIDDEGSVIFASYRLQD